MINFTATDEDTILIGKIADRLQERYRFAAQDTEISPATRANIKRLNNRLHIEMDITACHLNGNPLRLADLLAADDFNFCHDVYGIRDTLDRSTGRITGLFSPRFSARVDA